MENQGKPIPSGIGGWLILPAIGLILGPLVSAFEIWTGYKLILAFRPELIRSIWFVSLLIADVGITALAIVVGFHFFNRLSLTRVLFQALLIANVLVAFGEAASTASYLQTELDPKGVIKALVGAAIWIPYFAISKRARATFVQHRRLSISESGICTVLIGIPTAVLFIHVFSRGHEPQDPESSKRLSEWAQIDAPAQAVGSSEKQEPRQWTRQSLPKESRISGKNDFWVEQGHGFSIQLPEGWEFSSGSGFADSYVKAKIQDASNREATIGVSVYQAPSFGECDLWTLDIRGLTSAFAESRVFGNGFRIVKTGQLTIDGAHAVWVDVAYRDFGLLRKDYFLIRGARLFNIHCITSSDLDFLRQHDESLEKTAKSFRKLPDTSPQKPN